MELLVRRTKGKLPKSASDRELFDQLIMKNPWYDASMIEVFIFLYEDPRTQIPNTWVESMASFRKELLETVPDPRLVAEYSELVQRAY